MSKPCTSHAIDWNLPHPRKCKNCGQKVCPHCGQPYTNYVVHLRGCEDWSKVRYRIRHTGVSARGLDSDMRLGWSRRLGK